MPNYNSPPNWPAPPPGWTPPDGWQAPANWPPPPKGWKFWLPDENEGSWFGRHKVLTGVGGGLAALLFIGVVATVGSDPTPVTGGSPSRSLLSPGPTPPTTSSKNVRYDSVVELRDAAVAAGYPCRNWDQEDGPKHAEESGTCSDEDVFSIYATDNDLETQIELVKAGDALSREEQMKPDPTLVGPNWMIRMPSSSIYRVQGSLGGDILNTDAPSEEPTEDPTQAAQPKPMTYSGSGDEVVKFKKALTEPTLITTTWTGGSDNNTIYAYDADGNEGDLIVNTIGAYKGTNIINLYDGDDVRALKIEGSGNWKITLKPLSDAKAWDGSGTYKGKSDDVINVQDVFDGLDSLRFKSTRADGNITVYGLGDNGEDLIVNEIGNFSGKYLMPKGTVLLRISSDGRWEMKKA